MKNYLGRRTLANVLGVVLVFGVALAPLTPAAAAVPAAPTGLTPSGTTTSGIPQLTWNRVAGATSYNVQYSTDSDFVSGVTKVSTVNRRYVPKTKLPASTLWWRVQAKNSSGVSDWSTTSFDVDPTGGPTLLAPGSGELLDQPTEPVLVSWTPVTGAVAYTVQIDDAPGDFVNLVTEATGIKTTAYVVQNPKVATTYHWRVRAVFDGGVVSEWSEERTFEVGGLGLPVLVSPANNVSSAIEDVVLKWQPVPGAVKYNLQVSKDCTFAQLSYTASNLVSTTFSPAVTYDNDQYCWRVQPVDAFANVVAWESLPKWQFKRDWAVQPTLEYPITPNGQPTTVMSTPVYYQWTPVRLATSYKLQVSTSPTFPAGSSTNECTTNHTTYVPETGSSCWPAVAPSVNYWRVIAYDDPNGVQTQTVNAAVGSFLYDPAQVDLGSISPVDGASTAEPVFSWDPVAGAARYRVSVVALDGGANGFTNRVTTTTSLSPTAPLTVGKSYRWFVQVGNRTGGYSPALVPAQWPTFTVTALTASNTSVVLTSPPSGSTFARFPLLDWAPMVGASYYKLEVADPASPLTAPEVVGTKFAYSSGEDIDTLNLPRGYQWRVTAYDVDDVALPGGVSGWRTFTLATIGIDAVSGFKVGMTGVSTNAAGTSCTAAQCQNMKQTPVFRWASVPDAGSYEFWLCPTSTCESPVSGYPQAVDGTMFTPTTPLEEAQAGSGYWWRVVPCTSATGSGTSDQDHTRPGCTPFATATRSINKRANPVELLTPTDGGSGTGDTVTLTWKDYLTTNLDGDNADSTGVNPRIEAMRYRVQVSTVPNFQSNLHSVDVDQTTFTWPSDLYPDNVLYWRVIALDASGRALAYSQQYVEGGNAKDVRKYTKTTVPPALKQLNNGQPLTQAAPLQWHPSSFAASYDIEVYKNDDTLPQSTNKVAALSSKQAAVTLATPLPPSTTPYRWRIRKEDVGGNKGPWSSLTDPNAVFTVVVSAPTLVSPASSAAVRNIEGLFTWTAVQGARQYRFERRKSGATTLTETAVTSAQSWAPIATIADATWQWRVVALDTGGKDLGASGWRTFVVDSTKPTVVSWFPKSGATVGSTVNFTARFSEAVSGVSTSSVRVYRNGFSNPVSGAVTLNASKTVVTFNPTTNLAKGAKYYFRLYNGIKDTQGNTLLNTSIAVTVAK